MPLNETEQPRALLGGALELKPCPLSHGITAGLRVSKLDPRIVCLDCGLTLMATDWSMLYERWNARADIRAMATDSDFVDLECAGCGASFKESVLPLHEHRWIRCSPSGRRGKSIPSPPIDNDDQGRAFTAEVREVLEGLKEQFNGCWCRADIHTEFCQRARILMEKLRC
jgi:hypothetical protein